MVSGWSPLRTSTTRFRGRIRSRRVPEATSRLFVSEAGKRALESMGVKGVELIPVEVS